MALATGGTEITTTVNGVDYRIHTFTSSGTFTVIEGGQFEYLIVAGGGGAPVSGDGNAGIAGGGGGGVLTGNVIFNTGSTIAITVGAGGNNSSGSNSSILNLPVAIGGGRGGVFVQVGFSGGSGGGGGGRLSTAGGAGTAGQGFNGGAARPNNVGGASAGGGGGGAGGPGGAGIPARGGDGGPGLQSSFTGVIRFYAGGGGGMANGTGGTGGSGVGGNGVSSGGSGTFATGGAGSINTGGGGGGGNAGSTGGSGVVIIRYVFVEPIFEPEVVTVSGGEGGAGGPFAAGGGGAAGYTPASLSGPQDNLRNYDVLAITANGDNTAQNNAFLDSSTNNFAITRNGNATQGSFSPFSSSGWSAYFDGTTSFLSIASGNIVNFGTADFTAEAWINLNVIDTSIDTIIGNYNNGSNGGLGWYINRGTNGGIQVYSGNSLIVNANSAVVATIWNHIAICRSSGTTRIFVNGSVVASAADSSNYGIDNAATGIGGTPPGGGASAYIPGYISNVRVVKGTAVYTANFTPPTAPLQPIAGTSLLTCQDNRFVDRSANNFAITRFGDTRVMTFSPFLPTTQYSTVAHSGSAYFDGSGDFLTVPANAAFQFPGDFTLETWIYWTGFLTNTGAVVYATGGSGASDQMFVGTGGALFIWNLSGGNVPVNQWTHIASSRSGSTLSNYINGVRVATASNSTTLGSSSAIAYVGIRGGTDHPWQGWISQLRIVKGTALYDPTQTTITVPTTPLTAVSGTSFLLNFANAAVVDASGKNNIETLNGAQISTSVTKHGSGSVFFDGVDDRLVILNNPNLILAGGPWTVECWVYFTGNYSNFRAIFSKRTGVSASSSYQGYIQQTTGLLSFYNGTQYASTAQVTANQWHHCAWVYTGTNIEIYFNGVRVLNTAVTITEVNEPVRVGSLDGNTEAYMGYIDDFRITKGVARYSAAATFTPPDEIYLPPPTSKLGAGAGGDALQAGENNTQGGGAGGGSSSTVGGGGGGVGITGIIAGNVDRSNAATGGVKTTYTDAESVEYIVHTFNSSGTFTSDIGLNVDYIIGAGGGGGGFNAGAGGGAGGLIISNATITAQTHVITVGAGGAGRTTDVGTGDQGTDSSAFGTTAIGGGGGKSSAGSGQSGGSGGGGSATGIGGDGVLGQGNKGGDGNGQDGASRSGAGGGGAGAVGQNTPNAGQGGAGGAGLASSISGASVTYAGGGGGSPHSGSGGAGGSGGGGAGGTGGVSNGTAGTTNTGGGGGAGGGYSFSGANGGSGVVVIRYTRFDLGQNVASGGAVGQSGAGSNDGQLGVNGNGGLYGGGGGGTTNSTVDTLVGNGAGGAMKIIWPAVRQYPFPDNFPSTVTNALTSPLLRTILSIDTPEQKIPMITTTVPVTESLTWVDNLNSVYEIDTVVEYEPKFSVNPQKPIPLSPFVSTAELQILVTEIDHELMLITEDPTNLATWDNPTRYEKIERVTLENDPRRITVRLLNFVIGVTGEGALVPTQIQTWF
jgi:hypothetical protein